MKELGTNQTKVLETLILLWNEKDGPIHQEMIARRSGLLSSSVHDAVFRLTGKGYVERIGDDSKTIEIKPLKFPDGQDFMAAWTPRDGAQNSARVMRVPSVEEVVAAALRKKEADELSKLVPIYDRLLRHRKTHDNVVPIDALRRARYEARA